MATEYYPIPLSLSLFLISYIHTHIHTFLLPLLFIFVQWNGIIGNLGIKGYFFKKEKKRGMLTTKKAVFLNGITDKNLIQNKNFDYIVSLIVFDF